MTRNIFKLFVVSFALLLFAVGCNEQDKGPSVAVVDAEKVLKASKVAKEAMEYVESLNANFSARVGEMQAELEADAENKELSDKLQAEFMTMQADFEREQNDIAEKLNNHFESALEEYRVKNKLEAILHPQAVISSSPDADISSGIAAIMDAKPLDLPKAKAPKADEGKNTAEAAPAGNPAASQSENSQGEAQNK